jgi:hypothetical protein
MSEEDNRLGADGFATAFGTDVLVGFDFDRDTVFTQVQGLREARCCAMILLSMLPIV